VKSSDSSVDFVSVGVQSLLGWSPDQLLGKDAHVVFEDLRLTGGSEDFVMCRSASGKAEMRVRVIDIAGLQLASDHMVAVLDDAAQLREARAKVSGARERWERVNRFMYPPRFRQGPVFVEEAAVIAVDILGLDQLDSSPSVTTSAYGKLIFGFEYWCSRRGLDIVGSVGTGFVAVLGLSGGTRQTWAEALFDLCIDVTDVIDDISWKHNILLGFAVGIHISGPVVAGISGQSERGFAVVGRPIAQAVGLMRAAQPGSIHMSERVLNALVRRNVAAKKRGEVQMRLAASIGEATYDVQPPVADVSSQPSVRGNSPRALVEA
jgi:class 3 adenylate cyclase